MAYRVPTLDEIIEHGMQRHRAELEGTDAFLWPNTEHIFIKTVGGMVHAAYCYLDWIKRQRFATEAEAEELEAHGAQFGMTRHDARRAHGLVRVTGTVGETVADGTQFQRSDGVVYAVTGSHVIAGAGFIDVTVEAVEAGAAGNAIVGVSLQQVVNDPSISAVVIAADGIGAGSDIETWEAFRSRLLFRLRNPPRGGAAHDYVFWALSIPGVTRVWVDPVAYGPGTVGVWFMTDGLGSGIPNAVALGDVEAYIETQRPVTARPIIQAPKPATIDIRIDGLASATEQMRALIDTELSDVFRRQVQVSMPGAPYAFNPNLLWQAVARVTGDATHSILMPSAPVHLDPGYIPIKGKVCYV